MISDLDASLRNLLVGEAQPGSELAGATISFSAPDATWRGQGNGLVLDLYLYKVNENRELRSNERRLLPNLDGSITVELAPTRVECSYVITAWNKSANLGGVERERQEHRLLSQVLFVLLRNPLLPRPYLAGVLAGQEIDLPLISAQTDEAGAVPDFWSGLETYLRPSITCKVTVAIDLRRDVTGPMVTAVQTGIVDSEPFFMVGGRVFDSRVPPRGIPNAWVRVDETGRTYVTDRDGHFVIDRIMPGTFTLIVRAVGFQEGSRPIMVPQPDGVYDVQLVPL